MLRRVTLCIGIVLCLDLVVEGCVACRSESWGFVKGVREIGLGVIMARYGLDCGFVYQWVDV